ncbi:MAG: hypothetical protein R3A51_02520 [Nannocystaceae bacterium]|nr:hypothetical protein [Myxococcales bacterium]
MKRSICLPATLALLTVGIACGESRSDLLKRQASYSQAAVEKDEDGNPIPQIPPDPVRDELRPVLEKIYSNTERLPAVLDDDITSTDERFPYDLKAGVLAVIHVQKGLTKDQKVRAILLGTAEADSWTYRKEARQDYAQLIHKIKYGYGDDQKDAILRMYADLRLLSFFNGADAEAAIGQLPEGVKGTVQKMRSEYVDNKTEVWQRWMNVKMYARRVVAGDEPFRSLLRQIKKDLGQEEPPPRKWLDSVGPEFKEWAQEVVDNEKLYITLTGLKELRERVEFQEDTHGLWLMEDSPDLPEKAKSVEIDKSSGVGVYREDLGGGFNELTFVFSKKLKGGALKGAFLYSIIFRQLLSDFQMLATAGTDFAKKDEDGQLIRESAIVPDKYDPLYARCGGQAALDTLVVHFASKYPLLQGIKPRTSNEEKILETAHKCVIEGARGDIKIPDKDDEFALEGPAPASRLALFQMLAKFENLDIDLKAMADEAEETEEDKKIDDATARLKALREKQKAEQAEEDG